MAIGLGSVSTSGFSKRLDQATSCAKPDLHGAHRGSSCSNDLASLALASIEKNPQKNPCEKAILFWEGFFLVFFSNFRVEFELKELECSCEFVQLKRWNFFSDFVGKSPPLEKILWVSFPGSSDAMKFHEMQRCWEVIFSSHTWCFSVIHLKTSSNQKTYRVM